MALNSKDTEKYVLVTPAKNEEAFIENTILSVLGQTHRPTKWVIVDDGSTDRTAQIVEEYARRYGFLQLLKLGTPNRRDFAKKAFAFKAGLDLIGDTPYQFVGNLDADITLSPDYYERILGEFATFPKLGIAGGPVHTRIGNTFINRDKTEDSIGGCVQMFRRECFEAIGGYRPLSGGGIDSAAEIMTRMHGWTVRKINDAAVYEHRRTGTAVHGVLASRFRLGIRFHSLGYGTWFFIMRCMYRILDEPVFVGSALTMTGFFVAKVRRSSIQLPQDVVRFLRSEQNEKLKQTLSGFFRQLTPAALLRSRS